MNVHEAIIHASTAIPRRDAELLLLHVLGRQRPWLLAHPEATLPFGAYEHFAALVVRRAGNEPLQYLTGHQEFFGLDLLITPDVLIPRPETELLVEAVLEWARAQPQTPLHLVDIGTGSGAIAIALAANLPTIRTPHPGTRTMEGQITALDLSPAALAVAQANASRYGMKMQMRFRESDLLAALAPELEAGLRIDAIVSNPPYVPRVDASSLQPEVRDFEPHLALFAGDDGLSVYRRLIPESWRALRPGGLLALEFGFGQQPALAELLRQWHALRFLDDLAGIPRVALAHRP